MEKNIVAIESGVANIKGYRVHVRVPPRSSCEWVSRHDTVVIRAAKGGGILPSVPVSDWGSCQRSLRVVLQPGLDVMEVLLLPGIGGYFNPLLNRLCRGPFPILQIKEEHIPFECECWAEVMSTHLGDYLMLQSRDKTWTLFYNLSASAALPPHVASIDFGGGVTVRRVRDGTPWHGLTPEATPQPGLFFGSLYQGPPNQKRVVKAWEQFQKTSFRLMHTHLSRKR